MKRVGNIYEKITKKENIRQAIINASKGKKDRNGVIKILDNVNFYVDEIYNMLINKTYTPSPYIKMLIHDGARKKERIIYKPKFYPDQIIHWALMQQIQPIIQKGMYEYCCASVPNRGIHYGGKYIKKIPRYPAILSVCPFFPKNPASSNRSLDSFKITSTALRLRVNTRNCSPFSTSSGISSFATLEAEYLPYTLSFAPFISGGCRILYTFSGAGEPSRSISPGVIPQIFSASSTGFAIVAELHKNCGSE